MNSKKYSKTAKIRSKKKNQTKPQRRSKKILNRKYTQKSGALNIPPQQPMPSGMSKKQLKETFYKLQQLNESKLDENMKQMEAEEITKGLSNSDLEALNEYKPGAFGKAYIAAKRGAKAIYSDEKESVVTMGANLKRKKAELRKEASGYLRKMAGKNVDTCSLVKDKIGEEDSSGLVEEILRKTKNHPFFKSEDEYFKSLLNRNMKGFCFNKSSQGDNQDYSIFCKSVLNCLKTPAQINDILFQAIDPISTKRMFDELPGYYDPSDTKNAIQQSKKEKKESTYFNLKKQIADRIISQNKEIATEKDKKQKFAMILSVLQNENKRSLAAFLVEVLIKTMIDYKDAEQSAPPSYTGKIFLQTGVDKLIKRLKSKSKEKNSKGKNSEGENSEGENSEENNNGENNNKGSQSGGAEAPLSSDDLKKIGIEDLYKGMSECDIKDLIKSEQEDRKNEIDMLEDSEVSIDDISEGLQTPKLLYIVMGSFILVSLIELGVFDAPECLTHTLI